MYLCAAVALSLSNNADRDLAGGAHVGIDGGTIHGLARGPVHDQRSAIMATTLSAVQATFHAVAPKAPGDEIEITVTDSAGEIVAQDTNNYGVFSAGSTNGPYGIEVLNQVDKTDLHPGGNVTINTPSWQPPGPPTSRWN